MTFHPEALSVAQKKALRRLASVVAPRQFYLGGETAVASYLGHRRSLDFDWFTSERLTDPMHLAQDLRDSGVPFHTGPVDRGAPHGTAFKVRTSFLEYRYPLLQPLVMWEDYECPLASPDDLASMKLVALAQRGSKKDFADIYALGLKHKSLRALLGLYQQKYSTDVITHLLYALAYFDDAEKERLPLMLWDVNWPTIKKTIQAWVKEVTG